MLLKPDAGVVCVKYHAGLSISDRREVHHKFLRDEVQVCVCKNAPATPGFSGQYYVMSLFISTNYKLS